MDEALVWRPSTENRNKKKGGGGHPRDYLGMIARKLAAKNY